MHPRVTGLLLPIIVVGVLAACAERQSPFEPMPVRPSSSIVLPPSVSDQILPITGPLDPSYTLALPTYAEALIAEFRLNGLISVNSLHPAKASTIVDGAGYFQGGAWYACYVNVIFRYTLGVWGPGPCPTSPPRSLRVDTVLVRGQGTVTRGPAIPQWSYECPGAPRCWGYEGEQAFSITPLSAAINLTTPGRAEVAPGTIEMPPPGTWTLFKTTANPLSIRGINVPVRVLSWTWAAAIGGPGETILTGGATDIQRSVYIKEPGSMVVTAFVNGVEQVDTVKVVGSQVRLTLEKISMMPSVIYTGKNDPQTQTIQVSVLDRNDQPMPNKFVQLKATATEGEAGHAHINASKPKPGGTIIAQVNTGPTGVVPVQYTAPNPSGPVSVKGTSSGAGSITKEVKIEVPGLVPYGAGSDYGLVGWTVIHPINHYATQTHISMLQWLASGFRNHFPTSATLKYNDSSLEFGGLFDVKDSISWQPPHKGHRFGNHTDLRTHNPDTGDPILTVKQKRWIQYVWYRKLPPASQNIIDHTKIPGDPPHFHLVY